MYIALYDLAAIVLVALFAIFAASLFYSMRHARKNGAPFYPTPTSAIRTALREAALAPGETFYDLGTGTGKTLVIAEKEFGARAIGFEIDIIFYCIAKLNLFFHRSRAKIIARNFFNEDLSDADVIFCFLTIRTMPKMEEKIRRGLKPGTRVIAYAFPFPTLIPIKTIAIRDDWKLFFYKV
jgi:predicted RNA methylase